MASLTVRTYEYRDLDQVVTLEEVSFKDTGNVVERYYPNGDDAIEMMRGLGGDQDSMANETP